MPKLRLLCSTEFDWVWLVCKLTANESYRTLGLDTNTPKNAPKIYPEILNFFPKNLSKNL